MSSLSRSDSCRSSPRAIDSPGMISDGGRTIGASGAHPSPAPDAEPAVRLVGMRKTYGEVVAVEHLSLEVRAGEFFTLLGPSGSGKTTTLRVIAGFELPDSGHVELHGVEVTRSPPYERPVNTVFQDYALFPHMSVLDNVAYGLRVKGIGRRERADQAAAALAMVRLPGVAAGGPGTGGAPRPRDREPPPCAAARRAARRARPEASTGDADRA